MALGDRVRQLDSKSVELVHSHPNEATAICQHQEEINELWNSLTAKADSRKAKLLDSYDFQRFCADDRDLMAWINTMMALVSSDELAKDVTGAEALLERHQVCSLSFSF